MEDNSKSRIASKSKERRQPYNQTEGPPKRNSKHQGLIKNDIPHLPPPPTFGNNSPVKKVVNEVNKIVKLGMEKEFNLFEKDSTLQNLSETVDNLRKNIIHLQMEYEKLDQNYQREISFRSDLIKRMDATKSVVDSAVSYSNKLSSSVKQLEDDKLRLGELYTVIFQSQKEVEEKHSKLEKLMKEKDASIKSKIDDIKKTITQKLDTIAQLNRNLSYVSDKLKVTSSENENFKLRTKKLEETINNLEESLSEMRKLNNFQQEYIKKYKDTVKELKFQKIKYQKLFKNKKKQINVCKNKSKNLMRNYTRLESLHNKCPLTIENLRVENEKCKSKLTEQLDLDKTKHLQWESEKKELQDKLRKRENENETLRKSIESLERKNTELIKQGEVAKNEIEHLQNECLKLKNEQEKLSKENNRGRELISELEAKLKNCGDDLDSKIAFYKNESETHQTQMKEKEAELSKLLQSLSFERNEKEKLETDFENKLKLTSDKVTDMEKLIEEKIDEIKSLNLEVKKKAKVIQELEHQVKNVKADNEKAINNLSNKLQVQNLKNEELNGTVEDLAKKNLDLNTELEQAKSQVLELNEKLKQETSSNKILKESNDKLEKNVTDLKNNVEEGKRALEHIKQNNENELNKIQKFSEENSNLKGVLQGTEARIEAYKVVVKRLETEKLEMKNLHSKEIFKLQSEVTRLEEMMKKEKDSVRVLKETPLKNEKDKVDDEPDLADMIKYHQGSSTPMKNSKKFLSTPRKPFNSTPQPLPRNHTPARKKRDPYEFDSDSSVERFDADKVLKVFNNRPKKEPAKKPRTNK